MIRAAIAAVLGAFIGAGALVAAYARDPGLAFEMDAPLPAFISGVYNGERDGQTSFAWTSDRMSVDLHDLDRSAAWSCTLRFRAFRPEGQPLPTLEVFVDDGRVTSMPAVGEFHDLGFSIPAGKRGARLVVTTTPAFTPGTADKRLLGVQIDRLACRATSFTWPPALPLAQAAVASAFAALMFALVGLPLGAALAGAAILAAGSAAMLTTAGGLYADYSTSILRVTLWVISIAALGATGANRVSRTRLTLPARIVFAISAVILALKMFALLHPSMPIGDALFNAHRLDSVMAGQRHFTQPVAGVQMPYAIGLYVFAWPWTWIATDHLAVIRTVTAAVDVLAAALLYPLLVRAWDDRRSAVFAVLFAQLAPLGFSVLGIGLLTNLFGQAVALAAMVTAVSWRLGLRRLPAFLIFATIVTWAFCSHVSTVTTLSATLGVLAALYWWRGDADSRSASYAIIVAVAASLVLSWFIFYREFSSDISAAFAQMFSGGSSGGAATAGEAARGFMDTNARIRNLFSQAILGVGAPMLTLALVGLWTLWRRRVRDRLVSALIAWAVVWTVFSASTVFSRVGPEFVRYAAEFLGRINLATIPLVAILAARGAAAGWDESTPAGLRTPLKAISIVLTGWSGWIAWTALLGWYAR